MVLRVLDSVCPLNASDEDFQLISSKGEFPQVLASISGPIEVRLAVENASRATLEVTVRPLSNVPATESRSLAATIASTLLPSLLLAQNPRTLVQIVIQTLIPPNPRAKWHDGITASMINASTLALMNAGSVAMKGIVCAVCVGRSLPPTGSPVYIVDPSDDELLSLNGSGCFAFLYADGVVGDESPSPASVCVWANWRSPAQSGFNEKEVVETKELARRASRDVWSRMKECVREMENPMDKGLSGIQLQVRDLAMDVESDLKEDEDAKMEI